MKDIYFPWTKTDTKPLVLKDFFEYLHNTFTTPRKIPISADLFGMVTTAYDDMGIGQVLENALPYFDYVAPMVYPLYYSPAFQGYKNPAQYPYEIIHYAIGEEVAPAKMTLSNPRKLRPRLQYFDLGTDYGSVEVRKQIQATYDVGLNSWML